MFWCTFGRGPGFCSLFRFVRNWCTFSCFWIPVHSFPVFGSRGTFCLALQSGHFVCLWICTNFFPGNCAATFFFCEKYIITIFAVAMLAFMNVVVCKCIVTTVFSKNIFSTTIFLQFLCADECADIQVCRHSFLRANNRGGTGFWDHRDLTVVHKKTAIERLLRTKR